MESISTHAAPGVDRTSARPQQPDRSPLAAGRFGSIPAPILPREHGAWAVVFVPIITAAAALRAISWDWLLLTVATFFVFISYVPMQTLLRAGIGQRANSQKLRQAKVWGPVYLAAGILFLIPLLVQGFILLIPLAAAGAAAFLGNFFIARKHPKTIPGDLLSVLGLSLGAPGAYYVLTGRLDAGAVILWVFNLLFFSGSVFYVHMKMAAASAKKVSFSVAERLQLGKGTLLYNTCAVTLIGLFAWYGFVRPSTIIALLPMTVYAVWGTVSMKPKVRFKIVGFLLLGQAIVFAALMGILQ